MVGADDFAADLGAAEDRLRVPPARANIVIQARYTAGEAWKADKQ